MRRTIACCMAAALLAGCQSQPTAREARPAPQAAAPTPAAEVLAQEQCAANMHEIAGMMLQYYVMHQQLPERLEELASDGRVVPKRCPANGREYAYFPDGLQARDDARWLVLSDATEAHAGNRSGIVVSPAKGSQPLGFWVVVLTEEQIRRYTAR